MPKTTEQAKPAPTEQALSMALNMAVTAGEHLRKYLPDDELLSDADKMAIALLEEAKRRAG